MPNSKRLRLSMSLPSLSSSAVSSDDSSDIESPPPRQVLVSSRKVATPNRCTPLPSRGTIRRSGSFQSPITRDFSKKDVRASMKRSLLVALVVFGIFWVTFLCLLVQQFHYGYHNMESLRVAFWEAHQSPLKHGGPSSNSMLISDGSNKRRPRLSPPRVTIPLPLPPQKVSVVLLNYSRPRMIRESSLMRTLLAHPNIDEVLLLHSNPKTVFEFVHPKVVNIDATQHNDEMGLSLRFYFCQLAKNEWVIHVDDDMEFTTEALNELLIEYGRNPERIVGRFGRDLDLGNSFNGYSSQSSHKSSEVILTKLMVMERDTCSAFFEFAHLIWDDVILSSGEGPLWNGEDIFMSLVANHVYGPPIDGRDFNNYAMDWLDVWQASDSLKDYDNGKLDICGGMKGYRFWAWPWWQSLLRRNRHYSYRGQLWQTAKQRLAELGDRSKLQ